MGAVIGGLSQVDVAVVIAWSVGVWLIRNDPGVEDTLDADSSVTLASKLGRVLGALAAPDVESPVVLPIALDSGKAQAHSSFIVASAEAAAVSPGPVLVIVVRPG